MPIVDKFNVDGQDYAIEPVLDAVPMQNSQHAVMSGGVFADKSDVPVQGSTKNFTAAGAYDFFNGSKTSKSWFGKVFGHLLAREWKRCVAENAQIPDFYDAAYGKGLWVAGTHNYGCWWSEDGLNWTQGVGDNDDRAVIEVVYANGIWVSSSTIGIFWSEDGKNWTIGDGDNTGTRRYPMFVNNMWFCAGANGNGLYWSEDGKYWTKADGSVAEEYGFYTGSVCYGNGVWVVASAHGAHWSEDGKTWTACTGFPNVSLRYPAFADGLFLVGVGVGDSSAPGVYWSEDGKTWTSGTTTYTGSASYSVGVFVRANGLWVCTALGGGADKAGCFWSADGKVWTQGTGITTYDTSVNPECLAYANGVWVCSLNGSGVAYSVDGKDWVVATGISGSVWKLVYKNGIWVCDASPRPFYSVDGKEWTQSGGDATGATGSGTKIYYAAGTWVYITANKGYCSNIEQLIAQGAITD